ncbi:thioesterase family protein [Myxococcota bacterium]|nr:thioesterase family protein [Myxococcota bacterium]
MSRAFFLHQGGDRYLATSETRGPWDPRHQHGGPPCALLAGTLERFGAEASEYQLARLSFELLRPAPIGPVRVQVLAERMGRSVQRLRALLLAGDDLLIEARAIRIRQAPTGLPDEPAGEDWPDPDSLEPFTFPFFKTDQGYHMAVEGRIAFGAWGTTPIGFWARPRIPLVQGQATSPVEALVTLADAQSGMGVPADPDRYTFVNPDLTIYLERPPAPGWIGFDIRSVGGPLGAGLAESALRDARGTLGRSAQSLVVVPR